MHATTDTGSGSGGPFARRREAVFSELGRGVMVLPAAPIQYRSRDTEYRYRPDSELFYLTGVTEPGAVAVLVGGREPRFELFVRPRDAEAELWGGPRLGPEGSAAIHRPDACYSNAELGARLPGLLDGADRVHYRNRAGDGVGRMVAEALRRARERGPRTGTGPRGQVDPGEILDELRVIKDEDEIRGLRAAIAVTVAGHRAGLARIAPGVSERAIEAVVGAAFRDGGAAAPGFATIVGAGANGCILHYVENEATVAEGDLVLVDAGAEVDLYNGDITRTYPATGRFTDEQRAVYEVVDDARAAAIAEARPGSTITAVHDAATRTIVTGLVSLGVLSGDVDRLMGEGAHKPFFPHKTSHWLGLDVHDPGDYAQDGNPRPLEPGMVFTVEPGLYFRPDHSVGAASRFSGIGVRIEDDVLITAAGVEVLTDALPTSISGIEALMAEAK